MFKDIKKNFQVVKYVFKFCPLYAVFTLFYIICNTISTLVKVYLIQELVGLVEGIIKSNEIVYTKIIMCISIYILIVLICNIYTSIYASYIKGKYRIIFIKSMRMLMFRKAKDVDYESFDNPDFYDAYSRAMRDGTTRGIVVYEDLTNFISSLVNVLALGTIIFVADPILIIIIFVSVIIRLLLSHQVNKNTNKLDKEIERDKRMYGYVNRTFYQDRFAAEIKTTSIGDLLIEKCNEAQMSIDSKHIAVSKKNLVLKVLSSMVSNALEMAGSYVYLVYKLFNDLTIPTFSSLITASTQFGVNLYNMADIFVKIKNNAMYIDFFLEYINYKPKLEKTGTEHLDNSFEKIEIRNVSFKYPNFDRFALDNINITLRKGEKIAIVGLNGAGKTTLIKLLLKFYNPTEGSILYNNQDIRNVIEDEIRSKYSIVFQEYKIYGVTIGENILMRKVKTKEDEDIIWKALENVGMKEKIEKYPDKLNTMCTREFRNDGAEFSGGELQRLVIARAFASGGDICVLDEPTSNLDPLAERKINQLIMEKAQDKAIILIAHRLSTVVDADKIILIEYGKIIEEGNHDELMNKKGKYYEMFTTQGLLYKK